MATFTAYKAINFASIRLPNGGHFISHSGTSTLHNYFLDGDDYFTYVGTGLRATKEDAPEYTTLSNIRLTTQGSLHFSLVGSSALPLPNKDIYNEGYHYGADIGTLYGLPAYLAWWLRYDDTINGTESGDRLRGYDGTDFVQGNGGDDILEGNRGSDTLHGDAGNDTLVGGSGWNTLDGGDGNDTVSYDWAEYNVVVNLSVDTWQEVNATVTVANDKLAGVENLYGSDFSDSLIGDELANKLYGGSGDDLLTGGAGNDTLVGQTGRDTLAGGAGRDYFIFSSIANADIIRDFVVGEDIIILDNVAFKRLSLGALNAENFVANTAGSATDRNDRIIYETDTGKLYYSPDGNGPDAKIYFAYVAGNPELTASDFFVI